MNGDQFVLHVGAGTHLLCTAEQDPYISLPHSVKQVFFLCLGVRVMDESDLLLRNSARNQLLLSFLLNCVHLVRLCFLSIHSLSLLFKHIIIIVLTLTGGLMAFKSIDGLMRHLRSNGIQISGSAQKRQLRNSGYFHGYKGYRFFGTSSNRLPFTSYDEVNATILYDSKLKSLLYGKMMFIETAVKNVALESILSYTGSESIQDMYDKAVGSYKNCPSSISSST